MSKNRAPAAARHERTGPGNTAIPTFFSDAEGPETAAGAAQAAAIALIAGRNLYRARNLQQQTEREVAELERLLGTKRNEASDAALSVQRLNNDYLDSIKRALLAVHLMAKEAGLDTDDIVGQTRSMSLPDDGPLPVQPQKQSHVNATFSSVPAAAIPGLEPVPEAKEPYSLRTTTPSPKTSVNSHTGSALSPYSPSSEDGSPRTSLLSLSAPRSRLSSSSSSAVVLASRESSLSVPTPVAGTSDIMVGPLGAKAAEEDTPVATRPSSVSRSDTFTSSERDFLTSKRTTSTTSALSQSRISPVDSATSALRPDKLHSSSRQLESGDTSDSTSQDARPSTSDSIRDSVVSQTATTLTARLQTLTTAKPTQISSKSAQMASRTLSSPRLVDPQPFPSPKRVGKRASVSSMANKTALLSPSPDIMARPRANSHQDNTKNSWGRAGSDNLSQSSDRKDEGLEFEVVKSILALPLPAAPAMARPLVRFAKAGTSQSFSGPSSSGTASAQLTADSAPSIMFSDASTNSQEPARKVRGRMHSSPHIHDRPELIDNEEDYPRSEGEDGPEPRQKLFRFSIKAIASADRDAQSQMRTKLLPSPTSKGSSKSSRGRPVSQARVILNGRSGTIVRPSRRDPDDGTCDVRLDEEGNSGKGGETVHSARFRSIEILAPDTAGGQACVVLEGPRRGLVGVLKNLATAPDSKQKDPLCWVWDPKSSQLFCVPFLHLARA
ncbi:hypothetical protein CF319_g5595 [Tilletia indica]|uniref:Uncharacterized protein n=1 Tax=Tilletia indica TaxID=43049 RepID=A0A177TKM3_9BASI|nr:hypothetical protein CF319_g5595 [Tilletia indica]KAE8234074.1 hypothetical protein CF326_g886 [Tilletia indica]KAE8242003.1 hypothetical protein A4X13_0g7168 [Tilletia indica]